ncbi:formylmethanofuran dehydrogenase subunit C [Granulibacter bethesdensis]|uniref:formylmethanofuran dehydrogenase subunit C n=1 Tax=Granulibacter bethesdensis TaxID=364410 RepID=UPI0003F20F50|nr:formylmethanofuran dehydrogenase subunit C [Granulibacter bethesdensis]AHJ69503.1 Tungsten-containing formylmethanofuran dehydrogenase, subunit C [Granulibacter bethesdensis]
MTIRLTLKADPEQRLDLSALTPEKLDGLNKAAIEKLEVNTTREVVAVGDAFKLRGTGSEQIVIEGGSDRLDYVGAGMASGSVLLDGDAGAYAGRGMKGGVLQILGSAGPYAASGLKNGLIEISGDVAERLGAPAAGEQYGMAGGVVVVRGDAGPRAGDRLRRGVIVIEGDAGEAVGSRMAAGTIVVCGEAHGLPGYLMRRGTLVLGATAEVLPTFIPVHAPDLVFTRLLVRTLDPVSRKAARLASRAASRYAGDGAVIGRGELFLLEA